jgi:hypothetical protein
MCQVGGFQTEGVTALLLTVDVDGQQEGFQKQG